MYCVDRLKKQADEWLQEWRLHEHKKKQTAEEIMQRLGTNPG